MLAAVSFYRAHGETRPPALEGAVSVAAFVALAVPGLVAFGPEGFVAGRVAGVLVVLGVRSAYLRRLLPRARLAPLAARAVWPLAPAVAAVLAVRLAAWGGAREPLQAALEAALMGAVYVAATLALERNLIAEVREAWQGEGPAVAQAEAASR